MFLLFFCGFRPPPRSTLFPSRRSSDLLRNSMCTLFGGREAEALLLDDISIGSASDLDHASQIARSMVEQYGDGGTEIGVGRWAHHKDQPTSEHARARIDQAIQGILERE